MTGMNTSRLPIVSADPVHIDSAPPESRPAGRVIRPAHDCWYPPAVQPTDLISVDFDIRNVEAEGLYLVEEVSASRVEWRGCRRFRIEPGSRSVQLDAQGDGKSWMNFDAATAPGWRIAGRVLEVYRPTI